jgi:branched-chain amino acid transport system ATP-binding protein
MLELHGIHAGYGRVEVLRGVDLVVPRASTVALLGANGAGKTTLLKVAAGLVPLSSGRILLGGEATEHLSAHRRSARLCLIPEGRGIFRQLTVRENVAMYVDGRGVRDALDVLVDLFPALAQFLDTPAGRLSGGQQQMVALSRALVTDAPVIMADELSVGLAPVVVDEIFAAVERLRMQGRSLLIVEQYVERALQIADYVYILHKGRVVFVGEPAHCQGSHVFEQYLGSDTALAATMSGKGELS